MHSFRIEYHLLVFVCSLKIAQPGDDPFLGVWHILTGYYSVSSNPQNTQQQTNKQTKNGIDSNIITDNYTGLNGLSLKPGFHSLTQVLTRFYGLKRTLGIKDWKKYKLIRLVTLSVASRQFLELRSLCITFIEWR